jgi:hypothetical protein
MKKIRELNQPEESKDSQRKLDRRAMRNWALSFRPAPGRFKRYSLSMATFFWDESRA